ncbi:CBS domain-containing protein [Oscillibacter sp.]|uniref:CBS domain-containing protein n=1 Tax=Oscillibacter sp. TaxID=1945593 RepID=UPI0028A8914D|nr:CBS domain-containing protein [Oscillibacter sp.]
MNIAYFLTPKNSVSYLYDDFTFRQGLEKMRRHGYSAIPVIARDGTYSGTVSEGDFLWRLLDVEDTQDEVFTKKTAEKLFVQDLLRDNTYTAVPITASIDHLLSLALNQNFIPVVDDLGKFIGIVTRKDILSRLSQRTEFTVGPQLQRIV